MKGWCRKSILKVPTPLPCVSFIDFLKISFFNKEEFSDRITKPDTKGVM